MLTLPKNKKIKFLSAIIIDAFLKTFFLFFFLGESLIGLFFAFLFLTLMTILILGLLRNYEWSYKLLSYKLLNIYGIITYALCFLIFVISFNLSLSLEFIFSLATNPFMASLALLISCIPTRAMIVLARDSNVFNKKVKDDSVNVIQKSEPERPFEWIKNVEEKIIRSRISWILFPAWFTFVVLNLFNSFKPYGEPFKLFNISIGFFIVLPFVFSFGWLMPGWGFKEIIKLLNPQFPDSMEDTIMYFSPVLFYVGYIALLVNIKKINKKWLYLILFFLLIFLVLSARGCANEEFSF